MESVLLMACQAQEDWFGPLASRRFFWLLVGSFCYWSFGGARTGSPEESEADVEPPPNSAARTGGEMLASDENILVSDEPQSGRVNLIAIQP
jgi:hypothetical protein